MNRLDRTPFKYTEGGADEDRANRKHRSGPCYSAKEFAEMLGITNNKFTRMRKLVHYQNRSFVRD
jgi:hypothetical protein